MRVVCFDLDGTLFDHRGSAQAAASHFFEDLGVAVTASALESWFAAEDEHFERWRSGQISFQEQRRERLRTVLPPLGYRLPSDLEGLDALFDRYLSLYRAAWRAFPGSMSLLHELRGRGYRLGLLTNGAEAQQLDKLARIGLDDVFDVVCVSERIGVHKPDERAFLTLAHELGVDASECLFVGDDQAHDVAGAQSAGMRGLLIDNYAEGAADIETAVLAFVSESRDAR